MRKLFLILAIFLMGSSAAAQKVRVNAAPGVDVAKYKTYAWTSPFPPGNPMIQQAIIDAVEQAMAAKGLQKVATDSELTIVFFTTNQSDLFGANPRNVQGLGTPLATAPTVGSHPLTVGTLVIDFADAKTKESVWRAIATHTLDHGPTGNSAKDAKAVAKPIKKAVDKMFKQFPVPN